MFSALESLLLRERVLDNVQNTSLIMMLPADYSSKDPLVIQVIQLRSQLCTIIKENIIGVQSFCAQIKISTATFYAMKDGKYISVESWIKIKKGFSSLVTLEEYKAFMDLYDEACYQAFNERW